MLTLDHVRFSDLCHALGVGVEMVSYHIGLGRIPRPTRVGGRLFVTRADAQAIIDYMESLPSVKRKRAAETTTEGEMA